MYIQGLAITLDILVRGHLLEGNIVYTTVEIVIGESKGLQFTREKDGTTPWE